jgi:serine/threonine protein kinase
VTCWGWTEDESKRDFHDSNRFYIVYEKLDCDLSVYLKTELVPSKKLDAAIKIAFGIEFMHSKGKIHRDIKPSNILVNKTTMDFKIADLGLIDDDIGTLVNITLGAQPKNQRCIPMMSPFFPFLECLRSL